MVNVLYVDGNGKGSNQLEQYFDEVAHEETIAIFCSFLMDKYDPKIYDEAFGHVCHTHSHVIPTHDYDRHREAVNCAITEVIGPINGPLFHSLVKWGRPGSGMPPAQEMLLWVKEKMPREFEAVLQRAKQIDLADLKAGH
jgi:hypothetical protein